MITVIILQLSHGLVKLLTLGTPRQYAKLGVYDQKQGTRMTLDEHARHVSWGLKLEYLTVGWNLIEALIDRTNCVGTRGSTTA